MLFYKLYGLLLLYSKNNRKIYNEWELRIRMTIGFNKDPYKKIGEYTEHIGKWRIIYAQNNTFGGKIIGERNGRLLLKPHQSGNYDNKKGLIRSLINKESSVNTNHIISIEPTTKDNLESACKFLNKQPTRQHPQSTK